MKVQAAGVAAATAAAAVTTNKSKQKLCFDKTDKLSKNKLIKNFN